MIVLDFDSWLPGTVRALSARMSVDKRIPVLIRASMNEGSVAAFSAISALTVAVDISVRGLDDLLSRLKTDLDRGPATATIPLLRTFTSVLTREQKTLLAMFLVAAPSRSSAPAVAASLGIGVDKLRARTRSAGFPAFPAAIGTMFCLHVDHWVRELGLGAAEIAGMTGDWDAKAVNQYVSRHSGVSCDLFRKPASVERTLSQMRRWFGIR
jgi:hypothetical protein